MAETCPTCGYCPTCKRAAPLTPGVPIAPFNPFPYWPVGNYCSGCGAWIAFGGAHYCGQPWVVSTASSTNVVDINTTRLSV